MSDLNEMWTALEQYQPHADAAGHGASWRRMTTERTPAAAYAARAAMWSAEAEAEHITQAIESINMAISRLSPCKTDREAMQLALVALELEATSPPIEETAAAMKALRDRLAAPQPEPVDNKLKVTQEQLARAESALESLRNEVLPKSQQMYQVMAGPCVDTIIELRKQIDAYLGILTAPPAAPPDAELEALRRDAERDSERNDQT